MNNKNDRRYSRKLTEEDENLILNLKAEQAKHLMLAARLSNKSLAVKFDCHESTITRVSRRYSDE